MQMMKWSVMALAIAAATTQLAVASSQSDSKGFVEDSKLDLFSRVLYKNSDFKNEAGNRDLPSYKEETGLGIQGLFESGFTQGTIGFGVDVHTLSSIRLDSGRGRAGTGQFGLNDDGQAEETQSEIGGAVKARLSNSVLKYGNQMTVSPVFATDDSRILPEVATGTLITSNEIEGLELSAGRFTAMSAQEYTGRDSINGKGENGLTSANIAGISYSFNDNFKAAIHASDVEDYWTKNYLNLNYATALADDQSLSIDFNYYRSKDRGTNLGGELNNHLWSLAPAYTIGAHTFTVAYQRSAGDTGYNYGVDGGGTVFVANSVQYSDFIGEQERSWQARYDLDMTSYGVAGLSFMTRYIAGTDIRVEGFDNQGKENEFNFETKYVFQDGAAKDLSLRLRSAVYRANSAYNSVYAADNNQVRLIAEYPLSIL